MWPLKGDKRDPSVAQRLTSSEADCAGSREEDAFVWKEEEDQWATWFNSISRSQTFAGGSRESGYARLVVICLCGPLVRGTFPCITAQRSTSLGQLSHVILRVHRGHALLSSFHSSGCYDSNSHTINVPPSPHKASPWTIHGTVGWPIYSSLPILIIVTPLHFTVLSHKMWTTESTIEWDGLLK